MNTGSYRKWSVLLCIVLIVALFIYFSPGLFMEMFVWYLSQFSNEQVRNPLLSYLIHYGPILYLYSSYIFVSMNLSVLLEEEVEVSWWKGYIPFYRWFLLGKNFLDEKYWFLVWLSFVPFIGVVAKIIILFLFGKSYEKTTFKSILISVSPIIFLTKFVFSNEESG